MCDEDMPQAGTLTEIVRCVGPLVLSRLMSEMVHAHHRRITGAVHGTPSAVKSVCLDSYDRPTRASNTATTRSTV